ncbi:MULTISPECIES: MFS transporter [Chitinophagaceae]
MNTNQQKLSVIEKVGYSLGDLAANLIFQTLMTFLAFFYTDVYKIPSATASLIIFIGGFVGAFFNIIMGAIADRTSTKWGKFRPWILWTAVPFGIIAMLAFSTPDFNANGKVAYAFTTYFLLVLAYSANNLPYSALSGVITGDMKQRNSLSAYRFVAVTIAQFVIQAVLLPLVLKVGHGDKAAGFKTVMTIFSLIGIVCFIVTFLTTKERVLVPKENKSSVKQDLRDLSKNKPWIIMLVLTILLFITLSLKGGMYVYYFNYYVDPNRLESFLQHLGLTSLFGGDQSAATTGFSLFNAGGIVFTLVGIVASKPLADRYGKRVVFGVFLFLAALCLVSFCFFSPTAITAIFVTQMLQGLFYGVTTPLLWAMIADVADYSEWKYHRRATAIIFSAMIFGLKVGLSIGGALVAGLLSHYGYVADAVQQSSVTMNGIKLAISILPGILFVACALLMLSYSIDKPMEQTIEFELRARRNKD